MAGAMSDSVYSTTSSNSDASISQTMYRRSLRIAEMQRRKKEADDPFVVALKYFSNGELLGHNGCFINMRV